MDSYEYAKEKYGRLGVDAERALERLEGAAYRRQLIGTTGGEALL